MEVRKLKDYLEEVKNQPPKEGPHIHSFVRYKYTDTLIQSGPAKGSKRIYYRCNDPLCTSVFDREMLVGKMQRCPECKDPKNDFILDRVALKRARPLCLNCRGTKEGKAHRAAVSIVEKIFSEDTNE